MLTSGELFEEDGLRPRPFDPADSAIEHRSCDARFQTQFCNGFAGLLKQQPVLASHAGQPHAPVQALPGLDDVPAVSPGDNPMIVAELAQLNDRLEQPRTVELPRHPERDRKIRQPHHCNVDSLDGEEIARFLHRLARLKLHHRHRFAVQVLDDFFNALCLIIKLRAHDSKPMPPQRRIFRPSDRLHKHVRRLDARENNSLSTQVQTPGYQRVLKIGDAYDRRSPRLHRRIYHILDRFETKTTMFSINDDIIEAGRLPDDVPCT